MSRKQQMMEANIYTFNTVEHLFHCIGPGTFSIHFNGEVLQYKEQNRLEDMVLHSTKHRGIQMYFRTVNAGYSSILDLDVISFQNRECENGQEDMFVFIEWDNMTISLFYLVSILEADRASFSATDLRSCAIIPTIISCKTKLEMILKKKKHLYHI